MNAAPLPHGAVLLAVTGPVDRQSMSVRAGHDNAVDS